MVDDYSGRYDSYDEEDNGSFWNDYIQQGKEDNSCWFEEWSSAIGDNYSAPDSYKLEGNQAIHIITGIFIRI